jgi:hypothetical protein
MESPFYQLFPAAAGTFRAEYDNVNVRFVRTSVVEIVVPGYATMSPIEAHVELSAMKRREAGRRYLAKYNCCLTCAKARPSNAMP